LPGLEIGDQIRVVMRIGPDEDGGVARALCGDVRLRKGIFDDGEFNVTEALHLE